MLHDLVCILACGDDQRVGSLIGHHRDTLQVGSLGLDAAKSIEPGIHHPLHDGGHPRGGCMLKRKKMDLLKVHRERRVERGENLVEHGKAAVACRHDERIGPLVRLRRDAILAVQYAGSHLLVKEPRHGCRHMGSRSMFEREETNGGTRRSLFNVKCSNHFNCEIEVLLRSNDQQCVERFVWHDGQLVHRAEHIGFDDMHAIAAEHPQPSSLLLHGRGSGKVIGAFDKHLLQETCEFLCIGELQHDQLSIQPAA